MKEAYTYLARIYDICVEVDYNEWIEYLFGLMALHNHDPGQILDIGCGTGNISIPLAEGGYTVTGVDLSEAMVVEAQRKAAERNLSISFVQQDLLQLQLGDGKFDTVLSICDVLNYLIEEEDLRQAFAQVYRHLRPGGLWLFDLNSTDKLQNTYGDTFYADLHSDFAYFWENSYDWKRDICSMTLTFFLQKEDGSYERVQERHRQKLWLPHEIQAIGEGAGFTVLMCSNFPTTEPCSEEVERWQFVLRKE
jgi:ubiquinone/menaquinone biosynthesis C-methylase UbiE